MTEDLIVHEVRSQSIGITGRCLNSARTNHFVIDDPNYNDGPAEEITPPEAFLAGISGCGVLLVDKYARDQGLSLVKVDASIRAIRRAATREDFHEIRMEFDIVGVDQKKAEELVEKFKGR